MRRKSPRIPPGLMLTGAVWPVVSSKEDSLPDEENARDAQDGSVNQALTGTQTASESADLTDESDTSTGWTWSS